MTDQTAYLLYCRPKGRVVIRDFFNPYGEVFALLTRPPETRDGSFGLRTAAMPQLNKATYWEMHGQELFSGRTRRLRIYVDGTVIFRASADDSFLCWPKDASDRLVNPVVVADSIVSFARFVRALLLLMSRQPDELELGVSIKNAALSEPPLKLYPGLLRSDLQRFTMIGSDLRGVGEKSPERSVSVLSADMLKSESGRPFDGADAAAFQLVTQFYDMFGFAEDAIPYVDRTGLQPRIAVEQFSR